MSQNPGQWGPQPGQPDPQQRPPQGQPPYPPQGQPPQGYPPQGRPPQQGQPPQGYPPQGYPPQGQPPQGYPPQPGYVPQGGYGQPAGYGQQGYPRQGGGYPPQGGYPAQAFQPQGPQGGPPKKKSAALIIGIVVAAVVALVAIGGIAIALNRGGDDGPDTTITPAPPTPAPTDQPTTDPSQPPASSEPPASTEPASPGSSSAPPTQPSGNAVSLGNGISVTPASGWTVRKKTATAAQLSDGDNIFLGQAIKVDKSTNPGQLCTAWHKQVAEGASSGKYSEPKPLSMGSSKLKGASCGAQVTVSSGQGSSDVILVTVASVRQTDGVTVLGTVYFTASADQEQLGKDFSAMVNSMLRTQAAGG